MKLLKFLMVLSLMLFLPAVALAQAAPAAAPGIGSQVLAFVLAHLTATVVVGTILPALLTFGGHYLSDRRKRQVATGVYYAAHIAADIDAELAPGGAKNTADKVAAYLQQTDAWLLAHGWRPLKPGEQAAAALQAKAMVGKAMTGDVPTADPSKAPAAA